ncbi:MAG: mercury methylation corrinoid protein HgcA, partial [Endomicrobiales bacterium]
MTEISAGRVPPEGSGGQGECCCGPDADENIPYRPVVSAGSVESPAGPVTAVSPRWSRADYLGAAAVRLGFGRMRYAVRPGLYAAGKPSAASPVLVSANYKLSFDVLRRELKGLDAWILVLDTRGVNVWCAAGKGTFGTRELVQRLLAARLPEVVAHRELILPQLSAPGIAGHMVLLYSGFEVTYGPVRAADIPEFLENGKKADARMRRVGFALADRIAVSWLELAFAAKAALFLSAAVLALGALGSRPFSLAASWNTWFFPLLLFWGAVFSGTVMTAALLPYLPGRAFSLKGGVAGFLVTGGMVAAGGLLGMAVPPFLSPAALTLMMSVLSAYLALQLTGASTFTSLSGVRKEIRIALPVLAALALVAAAVQALGIFQ